MKKKGALYYITALIICIILFSISCKTGNESSNGINKDTNINKYDPMLERKYLKEGFLSSDLFRVVIVQDGVSDTVDRDEVEDLAKKRSLASLKKFLRMHNRVITHSANAKLLNLISDNGTLTKKEEISKRNSVFYFDVRKNNIKRYIDSISPKR
jgi:hypothetical protein